MSRLEDALREALRREQAPDGFADRVMAAVRTSEARAASRNRDAASRAQRAPREGAVLRPAGAFWERLMAAFRGPRLRWAAGLAAVALTVGVVQHERERVEGERAKEQVMLALRITGGKLRFAQAKVYSIGAQQ